MLVLESWGEKSLTVKLGVVAIGRNEERGIGQSLESVLAQTLKPDKVIFVNDHSTDKTREIAESFPEVEIIDFDEQHETWVDSPNLSKIVNKGIIKIGEDNSFTHIMTMGGDTIVPSDYAETIIKKMAMHPEIVVASGSVDGSYNHVPRGSARITSLDYWRKIGLGYRTFHGFEGYHIYKAGSMGLSYRVFDINVVSSKPVGQKYTREHWYNEGISAKALGYYKPYLLGRACMIARKDPMSAIKYIQGYLSNKNELYEEPVRFYVKDIQKKLLTSKQKQLLKMIIRR